MLVPMATRRWTRDLVAGFKRRGEDSFRVRLSGSQTGFPIGSLQNLEMVPSHDTSFFFL